MTDKAKKSTKVAIVEEKQEAMRIEKGLPSAQQLTTLLAEETKRQDVLDKFINENLKLDIDYGIIPGTGKKPTLLKPGGEKVLSLFNLRPEWSKDSDTLEMIGKAGTVAFRCVLINRSTNEIVGEGRGVATPMEKKSWNANTQVKICEKRALIDAVLSTFALSSRYTQDVEDMDLNNQTPKTNYAAPKPAPTPTKPTQEQYDRLGAEMRRTGATKQKLEPQLKKQLIDLSYTAVEQLIGQLQKMPDRKGNPMASATEKVVLIDPDTGAPIQDAQIG